MPVWKLTPIDLDDPNWEASSHRSAAVVRAPDEDAARAAAAKAFDVATRFPPLRRGKVSAVAQPGTGQGGAHRGSALGSQRPDRGPRPGLLILAGWSIYPGGPDCAATPIS